MFLRGFPFAPSRNTISSLPPECLRLSWLGYQRSGQKELEIGHLILPEDALHIRWKSAGEKALKNK
jgi:hypothetical protein